MIYDIEDGIFDREAISEACTTRGYKMLRFHFTESNDGRENKFFAWLEPSSGPDLQSLLALESDLEDCGEQDDVSLSVDFRGDVVELTVHDQSH
jgi:hypothetical protein